MITRYLPELNHYFSEYWKSRGEVTIEHLNISEVPTLSSMLYRPDCIYALLFNNGFDSTDYCYTFKEVTISTFPRPIVSRLIVKKTKVRCFLTDDGVGASDIYNFSEDNIMMFDYLLDYRLSGVCDVSILSEKNDWDVLSELIYLYIDIYANNNYDLLDRLNTLVENNMNISFTDPVITLFAIYVLNEVHKKLKASTIILENNEVQLYLNRKVYSFGPGLPRDYVFQINNFIPYSLEMVSVFRNGLLQKYTTDYQIEFGEYDTATFTFTVPLQGGDTIVLDFYSNQLEEPKFEGQGIHGEIVNVISNEEYSLHEYVENYNVANIRASGDTSNSETCKLNKRIEVISTDLDRPMLMESKTHKLGDIKTNANT